MSLQVCPICLTNAKDLAFGCGHMVRTDSESLVHNNAMQQPTYRVSEKTCLLMFSFSFGFFLQTTVLQGMWGEPHQMPNMSTADTVEAEAIFGMNNML